MQNASEIRDRLVGRLQKQNLLLLNHTQTDSSLANGQKISTDMLQK